MRKRNIVQFFYLFLFTVFLIGCVNKEANRLPLIKIDSPFSFETINIKDTITFNILITNTGKEILVIDYIKIPCGCLADFKYDFYEMQPDNTDSISFIYRPYKTGYIEENVFTYFKGYKNPIHLLIKGRVIE